MKHMRGLFSMTQTLRHLFLPHLQIPRTAFLPSFRIQNRLPSRSYNSRRDTNPDPSNPPDQQQQLKDENIRSTFIQIANEEGRLNAPVRLANVLRTIERPANFVLQVSPPTEGAYPVCKVVNRVEAREAERARAKAAHALKVSTKQVELNWAIDAHDLSHRLKQLSKFLGKGRKVEVILTRKQGKRPPTAQEVKHVMDSVLETVREADSLQVKPMEGEPGRHVTLVAKNRDT